MDRPEFPNTCSATRAPLHAPCHDRITSSQLSAFTTAFQSHTGQAFSSWDALHDFSVRDFRAFWQFFLQSSRGLDWGGSSEPVCVGDEIERARFFPRVELNFADNLLGLSVADAHAPALTACHADGHVVRLTRGELRGRVARLARALSALGLREGDRVVGVMRNDEEAIVAALAVAALGATLSTAAPEMSVETILDRFTLLAPRLLFAHTAMRAFDKGMSIAGNIAEIASALPSLERIVSLDDGVLPSAVKPRIHSMNGLIEAVDAGDFVWKRFPFNQPLFIMFSSGTTGKPKCIVHGAGGSLLEHLKEHRLHSDLRPGDKMYFHTSCAWMMWNWQLSALASGVEIVTYDGPISTVDTLWRLVAEQRVTVFGTSPAYLKMCEDAGLEPGRQFDLNALRAMMSSGAVLFDSQFEWVHDHVKPLQLQSISGGTDILGCFVLGNPNLPVYSGQAQCKSLGLDVQALEQGVRTQGIGQLVCANPFPSRPLGFFGDADGSAFHKAYFASNPRFWTHGDLIEISPEGSVRLHGRSDGVLNVRGINVGPGEIYRVLNDIPDIVEAMAVEQRLSAVSNGPSASVAQFESRVVLLVVLRNGIALSGALAARIRRDLARRASIAHVPDRIIAVDALPFTHNGKPSEAAARNAVSGAPVGNTAALRNPECLDTIRSHPALNLASRDMPEIGTSRADLERYLQAQWETLFEFAPIGLDDNFFDLGGHSLLAARMLAEVRQAAGRSIPLSTMMIAPTIARLAAVIDSSEPPPSSSSLVAVRAGTGNPLFLAHSVSGSIMECLALVGALNSPRPVYGLQARGLDGEEATEPRVEDMASGYIEQMRSVQPTGPYAVAGFSFGGLVALEIAQQLRHAGEQIELLCMLDTYVHEDYLPLRARLNHQLASAGTQWRKLRKVPAADFPALLVRKLNGLADRMRVHSGQGARRPDAFTATLPPALRRVRETLGTAMNHYRPQPYDAGPIVFLRAAITETGRSDPLPLWRLIARDGLVVDEVSGGHGDMIVEPNVQVVAALLDQRLAKA